MRNSINVVRILVRILGTVMIVLGLLFWTDTALTLIPVHMLIGILVVLLLWTQAALAARTGEQPALVAGAFAWGIVVPIFGVTQDQILPGQLHWVIKVLHLLVGLGALALAEVLARRALARVGGAQPRGVLEPTPAP